MNILTCPRCLLAPIIDISPKLTRPITILTSTRTSLRSPARPLLFPMSQAGVPSETAQIQKSANMSSSAPAAVDESKLDIQSQVQTASGVDLTPKQKILVGSVLDLFAGKPTLRKLSLWDDDATFNDPLTTASGRKQYSAQWYGLAAAFSSITPLKSMVRSSGNPIEIDMKTKYVVKGLGTEKEIESVVKIHTDASGERITGVEDRWNGEIPEGAVAKAFRNLNAVSVPAFVSVPNSIEEEEAQKAKK